MLLALLVAAPAGAAPARAHAAAAQVHLLGNGRLAPVIRRARSGRLVAFRFVAGRTGTAKSVQVWLGRRAHAGALRVGLYSGGHSRPSAMLRSGTARRLRAGHWNRVSIRAVSVRRGRSYWIAFSGRGGSISYRERLKGCRGSSATGALRRDALPARWRSHSHARGCAVSAVVNGTLPAPPPPPPTGGSGGTGGTGGTGGSGGTGGTPPPPPPPIPANGCFPAPGRCGLPDPSYHNVGATSACSSLAASGSITAKAGQTIANVNVTGTIVIGAPNVTVNNVCVTNGNGTLGTYGIRINKGGSGAVITHTTVAGANGTDHSVDQAISNPDESTVTASYDYFYNCGECVWGGPYTLNYSYVITNGVPYQNGYSGGVGQGGAQHLEDLYCSDATENLDHDVLLDPADQNSAIFCDTQYGGGGPCSNHITITNSLMAGGAFVIYTCGNASGVGSSTMNISNNRIARCTTPPFKYNAQVGGTTCQGSTGTSVGSGADGHGYWPGGGYFGPVAATSVYCPPTAGQTWSGNVWDDNGAALGCRSS